MLFSAEVIARCPPALSPHIKKSPFKIPSRLEFSRAHLTVERTSSSAAGYGCSGASLYSGTITVKSFAKSEHTLAQVCAEPIVQPPPCRYIRAVLGLSGSALYTLILMDCPLPTSIGVSNSFGRLYFPRRRCAVRESSLAFYFCRLSRQKSPAP